MRDCDFCHGEKSVVKNYCTECQTHFPVVGRIQYKNMTEALDETDLDDSESELTF